MQQKVFFKRLMAFVMVLSLGFVFYNQSVKAGVPRIIHIVKAGQWGAEAYPWPTISGGIEGETYSGHGHALTGISYEFFWHPTPGYTDGGFDEGEIKVTVNSFCGILYCSRTYPRSSTYRPTLFNTDITHATAYSEGWIYMYPTTYDLAEWPNP